MPEPSGTGHGQVGRRASGNRLGSREGVRDTVDGGGERLTDCGNETSRAASVRAPFTETCWPSTARVSSSTPSGCPGERNPGRLRTSGAKDLIVGEVGLDGVGIGVEVEHSPAALHGGLRIGDVVEVQRARHRVRPARSARATLRSPRCRGSAAATGGRSRRPTSRRRARRDHRGTGRSIRCGTARGTATAATAFRRQRSVGASRAVRSATMRTPRGSCR